MAPKIVDLGQITIHSYGLLLALAFITGIWVASRNARKAGIAPDLVWNLGLLVIFAALVGSKLLLIFSDYQYYSQNLREVFSLASLRSPWVYYGGVIVAFGFAGWYVWAKKLPALILADSSAPGVALGQAIARIGCLLAGCCYGKPTTLPWGITFTNKYASDNMGVPLNIPLHPTQIYESAGAFCLFLFLMRRLSARHLPGQIALEYLLLISGLRLAVEFLRDDERGFVLHGMLSTAQLIAILVILGSAILYYLLWRSRGVRQS